MVISLQQVWLTATTSTRLHFNHLIPRHMEISHQEFGTLLLGIFCTVWTQGTLGDILGLLLVIFEILS